MRGRMLSTGLLAAAVLGGASATAAGSGVIGETQIGTAVLPIELASAIRPINLAGDVQPLESQRTRGATTTVTVSSDVLFAFNQATLSSTARATIVHLTSRLRHRANGRIRVDGYTDSIGSGSYNLTLSRRRAQAVEGVLRSELGGARGTAIVASGHGAADPVAPNTKGGHDDPAGRAQNRRVAITFGR